LGFDQLIRNVNRDPVIMCVELRTKITKSKVKCLEVAFDDNVKTIYRGESTSVQRVFEQYEKLTHRSGLEMNTEKQRSLLRMMAGV
jgi:hypothetical protein